MHRENAFLNSDRAELATLAYRVNKRCKAFFAHVLGALDESRRCEAARIFRQYKHLIDDNIERTDWSTERKAD
jgi:hypothetical protein